MASSTEANGVRLSAPEPTDSKALKKHLSKGTPISSHFEFPSLPARCGSETLYPRSLSETPCLPNATSQRSKDDAYPVLELKGKQTMSSQDANMVGQAASSTFDPRRLLDPKSFNSPQRQRDSKSASTESDPRQPPFSHRQLDGNPPEGNETLSDISTNTLLKRDREEDDEGQGMGNLIEKVHNVSQREDRPQKKSKIGKDDFDVEESHKAGFVGGGKGGDIGDYMKEKKKQGMAESSPVNAVVDLTGGTYHPPKKAFATTDVE